MEEWRDVPGFEGLYQVSNTGKVRSYDRLVTERNGKVRLHAGRLLRPSPVAGGYPGLSFFVAGQRMPTTVHRLVMAAFVGPCPSGQEVNHKDGDKTNNHLENLEYVTHTENQLHSIRVLGNPVPHGHMQLGEANAMSKLTEQQVKEIRVLYATGWTTQQRLGAHYGVSQSTVSTIISFNHWPHVA